MARILWVSSEAPARDGQGGQRRQFHQILALMKRGHDIHVLVPRSSQSHETLNGIAQVRRPRIAVKGHILNGRLSAVRRIMGSPEWDAIVVSHIESWWLLPDATKLAAPVLLDVHNVMSHWHLTSGRTQEADLAISRETSALAGATAVMTCSDTESARLAEIHPEVAAKVFTAPLGVDPEEWPDERFVRDEPIIAMFGTWTWRPNALGLEWFLDEVWPRVRERMPDAHALVAGSSDRADWPTGVAFVGRVEDLAAFTAQATVVAVPVLEGVGASVKFAESLATGAAVIATPDGANAVTDPPAHVSPDPDEWAMWIADRLSRRHVEPAPAGSRDFALRELDWDTAIRPVHEWLQAVSVTRQKGSTTHRTEPAG
jgi:polysaccharide biosynthesis protein PslH